MGSTRAAREAGLRGLCRDDNISVIPKQKETEVGCLAGERRDQIYSCGESGAEAGRVPALGSVCCLCGDTLSLCFPHSSSR